MSVYHIQIDIPTSSLKNTNQGKQFHLTDGQLSGSGENTYQASSDVNDRPAMMHTLAFLPAPAPGLRWNG